MGGVARSIGGFIAPKAPPPPPPPPVPTPDPKAPGADPAAAAATQKSMDDAADSERKARGRSSTLLTSGEGDTSQASVSKRTLLGA